MKSPPSTLLDRALAKFRQGQLNDAAALCDKILRQAANTPDAWHLLGQIRAAENRHADAAQLFARAIKLDASNAVVHFNLGSSLYSSDDLPGALASFKTAAELDPKLTRAHYNCGVIYQHMHRYAEAEAAYRTTLALDPEYFDALCNLVIVLRWQPGKLQHALQAGLLAVKAAAHDADNWNNLGAISRDLGDLDSAEACIEKALSISDKNAGYFVNMGSVMFEGRRVDESQAYFEKAVELDPNSAEAHMNLGFALLLLGDVARGWQEYEWRLRVRDHEPNYPPADQAQWRGEPPSGKRILVVAEQGLGDTLHFVRYAATLAERGADVTVACQPPLLRLLANSFADIRFVARLADAPQTDCWVPMMSLPRWLDPSPGVPAKTPPYLRAEPSDQQHFADFLGARGKPRVGLVWSGDPRPNDLKANLVDRRRSMHFSQMAPLIELPGIEFFSVQKGAPAAQLGGVDAAPSVIDLTDRLGDFADTAALLANLDLLITVDTSMAHLAGGLGLPVWMLSRFDGCWRWRLEGSRTPWYPSMTIYRQSAAGDWASVIARVKTDLESFAASIPPR